MAGTRRGAWAGIRRWRWPALAALLLSAAACGPLHTQLGDADDDAGTDAAPDADADADADPDVVEDADPEVDADRDFETSETTWLLASHEHITSMVRWVEPFPDGGFVVSGRRARQMLARHDSNGDVLWSLMIGPGFSRDISSLSVAPDGRIYVTANERIAAFDGDGRVLWQRHAPFFPFVQGLPDGSVILYRGQDIMRYSPTEGVLWRWHLDSDVGLLQGQALTVTEGGTIFFAVGWVVVAMDVDGNLLWVGRWSGEYVPDGPAPVEAAAPTEAGGVLLVGGRTISVARLEPDGRLEWLRSFGRFERRELGDPCAPRCLIDAAMDVAVSPAGEVMVVGLSTNAALLLGWNLLTAAYALWLDRDGVATGTLALGDPRQRDDGFGFAAAALSGGGWVVGGAFGTEMRFDRAFLASFESPGWPGGDCGYAAEASLGDSSLTATFVLEEATLSPSDIEVVEGEPLVFEHIDASMERLCW